MTWQFMLAGLLVGVLVGMTGMGGGSLMTPMLILLFGFDPKTAVGTDILHGAVFKTSVRGGTGRSGTCTCRSRAGYSSAPGRARSWASSSRARSRTAPNPRCRR